MQVQQYIQMFQRSWWIIALAALSALNGALISSYFATPMYKTTARLLVSPGPSLLADQDRVILQSITTLDKRSIIATYAEVMSSRHIYQKAREALQMKASELSGYKVKAVVLPDASALQISVEGPNPKIVTLLANEIGQQSVEYIKDRYQVYDISVLDPAFTPRNPFYPKPMRDAAVAVVLGSVLGAVLALLREYLPTMLETLGSQTENKDAFPLVRSGLVFQERLEHELTRSQLQTLSIGLLQLDGLQELKHLPMSTIQHLLERVVHILDKELGKDVVVERWNDTSFVILLPTLSGPKAISALEGVQQALSKPIDLEGSGHGAILLRPHIGVTEYQGGESTSTLINQAKMALRWSHHNGQKTTLFSAADRQQIISA